MNTANSAASGSPSNLFSLVVCRLCSIKNPKTGSRSKERSVVVVVAIVVVVVIVVVADVLVVVVAIVLVVALLQ